MTDTTIVGNSVEVIPMRGQRSSFSWGVAIAGALAAIAVSLLFYALGTGIGLSVVSPYSSSNPSPETMTVIGALWLIIAQSFAFATGGYIAGRLRTRAHIPGNETRFRDAAHGFMSWAIGVLIGGILAAAAGTFAVGSATAVTSTLAGNASGSGAQPDDTLAYYVDTLFRAAPNNTQAAADQAGGAAPTTSGQSAGTQPLSDQQRQEMQRVLLTSIRNGKLSDSDRSYIASVVAARTGMSQADAERRVSEVEGQARDAIKSAADTARKATAYLSFWTFMALLFGAVAATVAGMVGGALRDDEWSAWTDVKPEAVQ